MAMTITLAHLPRRHVRTDIDSCSNGRKSCETVCVGLTVYCRQACFEQCLLCLLLGLLPSSGVDRTVVDLSLPSVLSIASSTFSPTLSLSLFHLSCPLRHPPSAPHFPCLSSIYPVHCVIHLQPHTFPVSLPSILSIASSTFSPTLSLSLFHLSCPLRHPPSAPHFPCLSSICPVHCVIHLQPHTFPVSLPSILSIASSTFSPTLSLSLFHLSCPLRHLPSAPHFPCLSSICPVHCVIHLQPHTFPVSLPSVLSIASSTFSPTLSLSIFHLSCPLRHPPSAPHFPCLSSIYPVHCVIHLQPHTFPVSLPSVLSIASSTFSPTLSLSLFHLSCPLRHPPSAPHFPCLSPICPVHCVIYLQPHTFPVSLPSILSIASSTFSPTLSLSLSHLSCPLRHPPSAPHFPCLSSIYPVHCVIHLQPHTFPVSLPSVLSIASSTFSPTLSLSLFHLSCPLRHPPSAPHFPCLSSICPVHCVIHLQPHTFPVSLPSVLSIASSTFSPTLSLSLFHLSCPLRHPPSAPHFPCLSSICPVHCVIHLQPHTFPVSLPSILSIASSTFSPTLSLSLFHLSCPLRHLPSAPHFPCLSSICPVHCVIYLQPHTFPVSLPSVLSIASSTFSPTLSLSLFHLSCPLRHPPSAPHFPCLSSICPVHCVIHLQPHTFPVSLPSVLSIASSTFSPTLSLSLFHLSCPLRHPPSAPHFPCLSSICPVHCIIHLQPHTFPVSLPSVLSIASSTFSPTLSLSLFHLSCPLRHPPSAPHFPCLSSIYPVHCVIHLQPHTFPVSLPSVLSIASSTVSPTLSLSLFHLSCPLRHLPSAPHFPCLSSIYPVHCVIHLQPHTFPVSLPSVLSIASSTFSPTLSLSLFHLSCPLRHPPSAPHFPCLSPICPVHCVIHLQPHTFPVSLPSVLSIASSTFSPTLSLSLFHLSCPLRHPPSAPHFPCLSSIYPVHCVIHLQPHAFPVSLPSILSIASSTFSPTLSLSLFHLSCPLRHLPSAPHFPCLSSIYPVHCVIHLQPHTFPVSLPSVLSIASSTFSPTLSLSLFHLSCPLRHLPSAPHFPCLSSIYPVHCVIHLQPHTFPVSLPSVLSIASSTFSPTLSLSLFHLSCPLRHLPSAPHFPCLSSICPVHCVIHLQPHTFPVSLPSVLSIASSTFSPTLSLSLFHLSCPLRHLPSAPHFPCLSSICPVHCVIYLQPHTFPVYLPSVLSIASSTFSPTLSLSLFHLSCPLRHPPSAPHFPCLSSICPVHCVIHLQPHTFPVSLPSVLSIASSTFSPTLSLSLFHLSCPLRHLPSAPHFPCLSSICPVHCVIHLQPHTFPVSLPSVLSIASSTFSPTLSLSLFHLSCPLRHPPSAPHFPCLSSICPVHCVIHLQPHTFPVSPPSVLSIASSTFSPTLSLSLSHLSCPLRHPPSAPHFPCLSSICPVHCVIHLQPHTFPVSLPSVLSIASSTFSPTLSLSLFHLSCPLRHLPSAPHFPCLSPICPVHCVIHLQPHTFPVSLPSVLSIASSTFSPTLSLSLSHLSCPLRHPPSAPHFPCLSSICPVHCVIHLQPHTFNVSILG